MDDELKTELKDIKESLKRSEAKAGIAFGIAIIATALSVLPELSVLAIRFTVAIILGILGTWIIIKVKKPSK